jgi:hypothetical protein
VTPRPLAPVILSSAVPATGGIPGWPGADRCTPGSEGFILGIQHRYAFR